MKFPSLIGWALLGVAFFTAAAETVTYSVPGVGGMIVSAYDLWYTISPKSLVIARINIERNLPPLFWDPLLVTVLQLPAWLIFGIPGAAMAWFFRPPREKDVEIEEDSIFLYDRLVEAAREENMLEDYPLEYPYVPPDATLMADGDDDDADPADPASAADMGDDDDDPPDAASAADGGPDEPDGDKDGRA